MCYALVGSCFALLVAFISVLGLSVTASPALPTACGPNANILGESTFTHEGAEVKLTTISCPGSNVRGRGSLVNAAKRQVVSQCSPTTNPCSAISCNSAGVQPSLLDCNSLNNCPGRYIVQYSHSCRQWGDCFSRHMRLHYLNLDTVEYSVCPTAFATWGIETTTQCFTTFQTTIAGTCFSPEIPGNNWQVQAVHS
ncbi:hypothetical protein B0H14DRAFT_3158805 [Mycena olivaceomarginata]|nr:hypothetical protein B0H14DRAFT_3158805 [Mycena olivaceomarginata]